MPGPPLLSSRAPRLPASPCQGSPYHPAKPGNRGTGEPALPGQRRFNWHHSEQVRDHRIVMTATTLGVLIIVLVIGTLFGWHANRARAAHGDVKVTKRRIGGYRRTRLRSGLVALALAVILVVMMDQLYSH
jgi:heme/copper-type cytochrome/quinol oxidase subunit 2